MTAIELTISKRYQPVIGTITGRAEDDILAVERARADCDRKATGPG